MATEQTEQSSTVEIQRVESRAELYDADPYRRSAGEACAVRLCLDPESEPARLYCETYSPGQGTPVQDYHHRRQTWGIPVLTDDAANGLMERVLPLAQRVVAGYDSHFDGHNNVGTLTDDAKAARDEIERECQGGSSGWDESDQIHAWAVGDWLQATSDADLGLAATTTDEQIKALAARVESETEEGTCDVITGDVERYLRERRDAIQEREEEEAEDSEAQALKGLEFRRAGPHIAVSLAGGEPQVYLDSDGEWSHDTDRAEEAGRIHAILDTLTEAEWAQVCGEA